MSKKQFQSGLNFRFTCPIIDKSYLTIESAISKAIRDTTGNENVVLEQNILSAIIPFLEELRTLNSDMREAADNQIDELYCEVERLNKDLKAPDNHLLRHYE